MDRNGLLIAGILTVTLANVAVLIFVRRAHGAAVALGLAAVAPGRVIPRDLCLPLFGIIFSVLPALESQTRLIFRRYLEYRVTEKE